MSKYRWTIKITITEFHLYLLAVIICHFSIFQLRDNFFSKLIVFNSQKEKIEIIDKSKENDENALELSLGKKYRILGITYIGDAKQVYSSKLMNLLRDGEKKISTSTTSNFSKYGKEISGATKIAQDESKLIPLNDDLRKKLAQQLIMTKYKDLKECYGDHQQKDDLLDGNVAINISPKNQFNQVVVIFKGVGQKTIVKSLEACIKNKFTNLDFPSELINKNYSMKFNFNG